MTWWLSAQLSPILTRVPSTTAIREIRPMFDVVAVEIEVRVYLVLVAVYVVSGLLPPLVQHTERASHEPALPEPFH
jgi:hypothetical protein